LILRSKQDQLRQGSYIRDTVQDREIDCSLLRIEAEKLMEILNEVYTMMGIYTCMMTTESYMSLTEEN
jgi:hypothetical protein